MISKDDFRQALGQKANSLSDTEIERLRVAMDQIADIFFDIWNTGVVKENETITE